MYDDWAVTQNRIFSLIIPHFWKALERYQFWNQMNTLNISFFEMPDLLHSYSFIYLVNYVSLFFSLAETL